MSDRPRQRACTASDLCLWYVPLGRLKLVSLSGFVSAGFGFIIQLLSVAARDVSVTSLAHYVAGRPGDDYDSDAAAA